MLTSMLRDRYAMVVADRYVLFDRRPYLALPVHHVTHGSGEARYAVGG